MQPGRFAFVSCVLLIILSWPLPNYFGDSEFAVFDIPFMYFYLILLGPILILLLLSWVCTFLDGLDRYQPETEND